MIRSALYSHQKMIHLFLYLFELQSQFAQTHTSIFRQFVTFFYRFKSIDLICYSSFVLARIPVLNPKYHDAIALIQSIRLFYFNNWFRFGFCFGNPTKWNKQTRLVVKILFILEFWFRARNMTTFFIVVFIPEYH